MELVKMNINQRLEETEKAIDVIGLILSFLMNPTKEVDQELLDEKINTLEKMIKNRGKDRKRLSG